MSTLQHAAQRLRGLDGRDRAWLLARLASEERARIEPLLDALARGETSLDENGAGGTASPAHPPVPPPDPRSDDVRELDAADPQRVAAQLAVEPDCVLAALLAAERWSWRERFLATLPAQRRRALEGALAARDAALAPALREAVVAAAARRLREAPADRAGDETAEAVATARPKRRRLSGWLRRSAPWPG